MAHASTPRLRPRNRLRGALSGLFAGLICVCGAVTASAQHPPAAETESRAELLEAGVEEARRRVAWATERLADAREDVAETKQQLERLARDIAEARRRLERADEARKAAEDKAEKAKRQHEAAKEAHKKAEREKREAAERLKRAREADDPERRGDAEKALKAAEDALDEADEARDGAEDQWKDAKEALKRAKRKHHDAKRELDKLAGRGRRAESELRRRRERLGEAIDGLEESRLRLGVASRAAEPTPHADLSDWRVQWRRVTLPAEAQGIFVHPVYPDVAAVTTPEGLVRSTDGGRTWKLLAETAPDKLGPINDVAFVPVDGDTFYLASETSGVWRADDGGRTVRQVGSTETGLAHDCVKSIYVYPADHSFRTLYAVHGERAAGVSRSYDGGARWYVADRGYHARQLLFQLFPKGKLCAMYLIAGTRESPDVVNFYAQVVERLGGPEWLGIGRSDIIRADTQACPYRDAPMLVATLDKGLLHIRGEWGGASVRTLLEGDVRSWAAGGTTWGPRGNALLFAYEPRRLGLIVSEDRFDARVNLTGDLYVDNFVRDGASLRASADGGRFYAVVNGRLWVGLVRGRRFGIHDVTLQPRVLHLTPRQREAEPATVTLTARVDGPCEEVFADLRGLGGPSRAPLADDGEHADGAAGDGVYGLRWEIPAPLLQRGLPYWAFYQKRELIRSHVGKQGLIGVAVYAADAHGRTEGATGVLLALRPAVDFVADSREKSWKARPDKPWEEGLGLPGEDIGFDISGYRAVSFRIRCDRPHTEDLTVEMVSWNRSGYEGVASVDLEAVKLDKEYSRVVIPMARFHEQESGFIPISARGLHVRGKTDENTRYWLTDLRVHAAGDDPESADAASAKTTDED